MAQRPPIAVSCGDPAGIGPEVIAKAWHQLRNTLPFYVLGDARHFDGLCPVQTLSDPAQASQTCRSALPIVSVPFAKPVTAGQPDPANAAGVIAAIETAVSHVQTGQAAAICTAPISKQVLIEGAGFPYPGHTEFLAALAGSADVVMMLASPALRVVPATIHIPLGQVPQALTQDGLEQVIRITHRDLQSRFGIASPRIAVAGLNPHAGEGGHMGDEEIRLIAPVLDRLRAEGMDIRGPLPADTMFHAAARAQYDVAICMYHDQALIPIKALDFDRGVNVTLGLPFLRTSPDHGTGFDIAGQGIANPSSMIEALHLAGTAAQKATT